STNATAPFGASYRQLVDAPKTGHAANRATAFETLRQPSD
ncbi:MAG: hypothetical protein ACI8XD_000934, partial [Thermoproteota archaeon]